MRILFASKTVEGQNPPQSLLQRIRNKKKRKKCGCTPSAAVPLALMSKGWGGSYPPPFASKTGGEDRTFPRSHRKWVRRIIPSALKMGGGTPCWLHYQIRESKHKRKLGVPFAPTALLCSYRKGLGSNLRVHCHIKSAMEKKKRRFHTHWLLPLLLIRASKIRGWPDSHF